MSTPAWILDIFAAMMVLVAEVSAGQLMIARAWTRRGAAGAGIAVFRLLTGIAMAGILVPGLSILPNAVWEAAFAVVTAWFAWCLWRIRRGAAAVAHGPYAPHLAQSAAMLYIFAALAGPSAAGSSGTGGMSGMEWGSSGGLPALHAPTLALIFALLLIAVTIHDLNRQADTGGYFQVAGRPTGSALAAAAARPAVYTAERLLVSPAVVKGCQVAISVTMAFVLIIMI
jgi:hypothetical protein